MQHFLLPIKVALYSLLMQLAIGVTHDFPYSHMDEYVPVHFAPGIGRGRQHITLLGALISLSLTTVLCKNICHRVN